jgi:hypothetical protein
MTEIKITDSKEVHEKKTFISVVCFCGKNTPLKRYKSYFDKFLELLPADCSSEIVLCHSLGIEAAIKSNAKYIVALDPTKIYDDPRVHNWLPDSRDCSSEITNVTRYTMPKGMEERRHYPYEASNIRDKIVSQIQAFYKQLS